MKWPHRKYWAADPSKRLLNCSVWPSAISAIWPQNFSNTLTEDISWPLQFLDIKIVHLNINSCDSPREPREPRAPFSALTSLWWSHFVAFFKWRKNYTSGASVQGWLSSSWKSDLSVRRFDSRESAWPMWGEQCWWWARGLKRAPWIHSHFCLASSEQETDAALLRSSCKGHAMPAFPAGMQQLSQILCNFQRERKSWKISQIQWRSVQMIPKKTTNSKLKACPGGS